MTDKRPYGWDRFGNPITDDTVDGILADMGDGPDPWEFRPVDPSTHPTFRMAGRPSLTGERRASPRVTFRMPDELNERAIATARERGCSVSQLAREALEKYLAS